MTKKTNDDGTTKSNVVNFLAARKALHKKCVRQINDRMAEDEFIRNVIGALDKMVTRIQQREARANRIHYETFDPAIVALCRVINDLPELETAESCQGYIDGHRDGHPWKVLFRLSSISPEAFASLKFLVWLLNFFCKAKAAGFDVVLRMNSYAPRLNEPGAPLCYIIEGRNRHPDELAKLIAEMREKHLPKT